MPFTISSKHILRTFTMLLSVIVNAQVLSPPTTGVPLQPYAVGNGGVTANTLVQFDASGNVAPATTTYQGIAMSTASAGSSVQVAASPGSMWWCIFENAAVVGDIAIPGTTTKTDCRDSGVTSLASISPSTSIIGTVQTSAAAGTEASVRLFGIGLFGTQGSGSSGLADPGSNGIVKRISLNTTGNAVADADYQSAITLNLASYSSLSSAIAAIGSSNKNLYIPAGTFAVSSSVTVPRNVTLEVAGGGLLSVSSGALLTIQGGIKADDRRMFSGAGIVSFSGNYVLSEVSAKWWGAMGDGSTDDTTTLQAAFVAATTSSPSALSVRVPAGNYIACNLFLGNSRVSGCPTTAICGSPARVHGEGAASVFGAKFTANSACGSAAGDFVVKANTFYGFTLEDISINGGATSTAGSGASCLDVSWKYYNGVASKNIYRDLDLENCKDVAGSYAIDADQDEDASFQNIFVGGPTSSGNQVCLSMLGTGGPIAIMQNIRCYNGSYVQIDTQNAHLQDFWLPGGLVIGHSGSTGGTSYDLITIDNVQFGPNPVTGIEINGLKTTESGSAVGTLICNACNFTGAGPLSSGQAVFGGYWTTGAVINGGMFNLGTGATYFGSTYTGAAAYSVPVFVFNSVAFSSTPPASSGTGYQVQLNQSYVGPLGRTVTTPISLQNTGQIPTIAGGSGAGTSPTISMVSNSTTNRGGFTLTTGTSPTANSTLVTIAFNSGAQPANALSCQIWPTNAATAQLTPSAIPYPSSSFSAISFIISTNSTALAASTTYSWGYNCL
jgi:hypothetical protein